MKTSLESFFKDVSKTGLLTREEEISLSKRIEKGDQRARDKMIRANIRLAISIAKKYQNKGCDLEDLIQESNIGLIKAVSRYNWRKGFKFSTYACWWIRQAVHRHVTSQSTSIKLPSYARSMMWKANKIKNEYMEEFGVQPTEEELADLLGVSIKTLKNITHCASNAISLDTPIGYRSDSGGSRSLKDVIPDDKFALMDEEIDRQKISNLVKDAFSALSEREEKIIRLRFGIGEEEGDHNRYPITRSDMSLLKKKKGKD